MCAGGPPKPIMPIRPHSRAIVVSRTSERVADPPAGEAVLTRSA